MTVSRCTGTCVGAVVAGVSKVAGFATWLKNMLTRPVDKPAFISDELTDKVAALKSELAEARKQLAEMQTLAEKEKSQLASQLSEVQLQNAFLASELERATKKADDPEITIETLKARIVALEKELEVAKRHLKNAHNPVRQLLSEVDAGYSIAEMVKNGQKVGPKATKTKAKATKAKVKAK